MNTKVADSQRVFSRVPFHAPVRLELSGQTRTVTLLDIALKGALVRTAELVPLTLQEPCRLVLSLSEGDDSIEMSGQVVHLEGQNVGIACTDIDVLSLTRLRRLLELNTGDADLMDRELSHLFIKR
jgi:hypothetical protein